MQYYRGCDTAVDEVAVAGAGVVDGVDGFAKSDGPIHGVHCPFHMQRQSPCWLRPSVSGFEL